MTESTEPLAHIPAVRGRQSSRRVDRLVVIAFDAHDRGTVRGDGTALALFAARFSPVLLRGARGHVPD